MTTPPSPTKDSVYFDPKTGKLTLEGLKLMEAVVKAIREHDARLTAGGH